MIKKPVPCFYHPTTLVLIDDDADFLYNLKLALINDYRCEVFIAPQMAQNFLFEKYQQYQTKIQNNLNRSYETSAEFIVELNPSKIQAQITEINRFNHACITILDYDMPINGLEVAHQIKNTTDSKIIMLTGQADQTRAVQAFNQQKIDAFVSKGSPDFLDQLKTHIQTLQYDYFVQYSMCILKSLQLQDNFALFDEKFKQLFEQICDQYHIIEYYIMDESGSFLMLDAHGEETYLIVRNNEDMRFYYELAQDADYESKQEALIKALNQHKKVIIFKPERDHANITNWIIKDAICLKEGIYYALLNDHDKKLFKKENVQTYQDFLHQYKSIEEVL